MHYTYEFVIDCTKLQKARLQTKICDASLAELGAALRGCQGLLDAHAAWVATHARARRPPDFRVFLQIPVIGSMARGEQRLNCFNARLHGTNDRNP